MTGRLGGKSKPKEPAEVNSPNEFLSVYFSAIRMGMRSPPKARMVTPDPPVKEVKKAQTKAGHDGGAALHGPEQGLENSQQAFGGPALGQKISGQREKGNGRDRGIHHHPVGLGGDGADGGIGIPKEEKGRAPQGHENRGAQNDRCE